MRDVARKVVFWIWIAVLTWLSLKNTNQSASWLHEVIPQADKVMHFGAYAFTTLLGCFAFKNELKAKKADWIIIAGCVSWSIIMELVQLAMASGRRFEVLDIIANIIGCFAGVAAYRIFKQSHYGSK